MRKNIGLMILFILFSPAVFAAEITVTQSHAMFDVPQIVVKKGDTIIFTNKDNVLHNIQVIDSSGNIEDKGLQNSTQEIREVFMLPGQYTIRCALHPKMSMKIIVQ